MDERAIGTSTAPTGEDSDDELAKEWRSLDWHSIERQVSRTQTKISKAVMAGNHNDAKRLQPGIESDFHHQRRPQGGLMVA